MRYKTPVSLNWLIKTRARLQGELIKLDSGRERQIDIAKKCVKEAEEQVQIAKTNLEFVSTSFTLMKEEINKQISAIDIALSLHEVQINPKLISPTKTQVAENKLPYGMITREIFECLRIYSHPVSVRHVTQYLIMKHDLRISEKMMPVLREQIRKRMRTLVSQGKLVACHTVFAGSPGSWRLP